MALEQFNIIYIKFGLTNFIISFIFCWIMLNLIWFFFQYLVQEYYIMFIFILNLINQQITNYQFYIYIPFLLSLVFIILNGNYNGLIAYVLTFTSHIWVTLSLALSSFIGITLVGILNNGINFQYFFIPSGVSNKFLLSFLVFIEILSYIIRPLSLSIRLFANMLAGHTLLFILGSSVLSTKKYGLFGLNFFPLLIVCAVLFLELAIAGIQSYVFFILLIIYLADMYSIANH